MYYQKEIFTFEQIEPKVFGQIALYLFETIILHLSKVLITFVI
jgi:hypothetical protein